MILRLFLAANLVVISVYGLADDSKVEAFRNSRVELRDPGVLMRQHSTHGIPGRSFSSQQSFSESQRFVNGQPVYENRHERRFENGRLVHEDGFEIGDPHASLGSVSRTDPRLRADPRMSVRSGIGGNTGGLQRGRTEHSRSSWQSSSSGMTGGNIDSSSLNCETCFGADHLRQAGVGAISIPSTSTGVHSREERVQEQHFRNGNPVYRRNEERRFENNDLVHEDIDEDGQRIGVQPVYSPTSGTSRRITSQRNRQSGVSYRPSYSRNTGRSRPSVHTPVPSVSSSMRNSSILTRTNERVRSDNRPTHRVHYNPSHSRTSSSSSARTVSVREREEAVVPSAQHLGRSGGHRPVQDNRQPQYSTSNVYRHSNVAGINDQAGAPVVHVPYDSSPYSGRPYQPSSFSTYSNWSAVQENRANGGVSAGNPIEVDTSNTPNTVPDHRRYRTETRTTPSPSVSHSSQSESLYSSSSTSQHSTGDNSNIDDHRRRTTIQVRPNSTIGLSLSVNPHQGSIYNVREHNSSLYADDYSRHDIDPRNGEDRPNSVSSINEHSSNDARYSGTVRQPLTGYDGVPDSYSSLNYRQQTTRSRAEPTISSYRVETKTSRRYLNGRLESEIKHNKYYENGVLLHQNQTETSRDELESTGIDVVALDLTTGDLEAYGVLHTDAIPTSHSQKYERKEEYEYVNGAPVFQLLHERKYQDGQLVDENRDEQDEEALRATTRNGVSAPSIGTSVTPSRSEYYSQNRHEISRQDNRVNYASQPGSEQPVQPSPSIVTNDIVSRHRENNVRTHHVRNEQVNRNVYPISGDHLERDTTEEENRPEYRDALTDLMTGRNFATAREHTGSFTRTYSRPGSNTESQRNAGSHVRTIETAGRTQESLGHRSGSEQNYHGQYGQSTRTNPSSNPLNTRPVGDSLLNSRHRTSLIGGSEINSAHDLREAIRGGSSQSSSSNFGSSQDSEKRHGNFNAFANFDITSDTGAPYGQGTVSHRSQSEREEHYENGELLRGREAEREWRDGQLLRNDERNYLGNGQPMTSSISSPTLLSQTAFQTGGSGGHFGATASFSAQTLPATQGQTYSSRSESAVDERYENGRLITGREHNREWENDQLLRNDRRSYGQEGGARATTRSGASRFNTFGSRLGGHSRLGLSGGGCGTMAC